MPLAHVPQPGQIRAGTRTWGSGAGWWLEGSLVNRGQGECPPPSLPPMHSAPPASCLNGWPATPKGHSGDQPLPGACTLVLNLVLPLTSHVAGSS